MSPQSLAVATLAAAVVAIAAATTLAGADTPCATLFSYCQLPTTFYEMRQLQCLGQILLMNGVPVLVALLAAPASLWKSGTHLLVLGMIGAGAGAMSAAFGEWPTIDRDVPIHFLASPLVASIGIISVLWLERAVVLLRSTSRPRSLP